MLIIPIHLLAFFGFFGWLLLRKKGEGGEQTNEADRASVFSTLVTLHVGLNLSQVLYFRTVSADSQRCSSLAGTRAELDTFV